MKKRIRINGIIIICAVVLAAAFPGVFLRQRGTGFGAELVRMLGFGLIFLGQLFRVSARGYKAEHSKSSRALVRGGPYKAVRNPMYLGILLIGLGVILVLFRWWVAVVFLSVFITRYISLISKEEEKLLVVFFSEYQDYMHKVPRIFPSLKMLGGREVSEYLTLKFAWFRKEIVSMVALVSVTLLTELWQAGRCGRLGAYPDELAATIIMIILFICLVFYLDRKTYGFKEEITIKG